MIKTTAIKLKNPTPFIVTWEMLRRCNYDCSYCESTRHNNYSPYPSFEELKTTFDFIKSYADLYNSKRLYGDITSIDFTGGEPTANPNFWPLIEYIKTQGNFALGLTTNGSWGPQFTKRILDNFVHVTVSWHSEADQKLKDRSIKNIIGLHDAGMSVQANVMLHCDYFDEAVEVCNLLKSKGISRLNPVPIGDGNIVRKGWFQDADGNRRRTSHEYTEEQQNWFFEWMGQPRNASTSAEGTNVGRACCGGRCTQGKVEDEWQDIKLVNNWFKDWYCTVNWFFMHVEQHTGNVFHHQTCQATHTGRGPIGNLRDTETIISQVEDMLSRPVTPIICPNQRCGCGMCVPKAKEFTDFEDLWKATTIIPIYEK
jgi:MoaA/NifB/PqqE/SkfB family radical SAM enzyme